MLLSPDELQAAVGPTGRLFLHPDELEPLGRWAGEAGTCIVEIGTAWGATAVLFLAASGNKVRVHSIDPFVRDPHSGWQASEGQARACVEHAVGHLGLDPKRWVLHVGTSYDLALSWDKAIDLLFIDGDHSYVAVARDVNDWLLHVRDGGLLVLHDARRVSGAAEGEYARGWPGPTRLAVELEDYPGLQRYEEIGSLISWRVTHGKKSEKKDG